MLAYMKDGIGTTRIATKSPPTSRSGVLAKKGECMISAPCSFLSLSSATRTATNKIRWIFSYATENGQFPLHYLHENIVQIIAVIKFPLPFFF